MDPSFELEIPFYCNFPPFGPNTTFLEQLGDDSTLERSLDEPCMFRQSDFPPLGPNTTLLEQLDNDF